jgi:lysophospholipid acyltransferase (LPLAT)-like uncharacterized protein
MAKVSGSANFPMGFGYSRKVTLKSWDRFQFPLPFSRIVVILGAPFYAPGPVDEAKVKLLAAELAKILDDLTERAGRFVPESKQG